MAGFTHFSRHAFQRVAQRTGLSCEDVTRILNRGLTVNSGQVPGFNRNHLVFFSVPDKAFFVAIQDALTGTVVTILPLEYQANLAWKITEQDCAKAKALLLNAPPIQTETPSASVFVISGHFLDADGTQKTKVIHRIASVRYRDELKMLLADDELFSELHKMAEAKGIDAKRMFGISVRHGNHGDPVAIDLRNESSPNITLQADAKVPP